MCSGDRDYLGSNTHACPHSSNGASLLAQATGTVSGDEEQTFAALFGMPEPHRLAELERSIDAYTAAELTSIAQEWGRKEVTVG